MHGITLTEILGQKKELDDRGMIFIEGSQHEVFLSYKGLYHEALRALLYFQRKGIRAGDELVLQIGDNKTFVIAFWACILGGMIPVPLSLGVSEDHKQKLFNVWMVLHRPHYVTSRDNFERTGLFARSKGLNDVYARIENKILYETDLLSFKEKGIIHKAEENDIAFVQFSSGSTGNPKGVILTHKNLLTNIKAISKAAGYSSGDSTMSWMPLTHDMGLIGFHLNPLFCGMDQYLMPTSVFIRCPSLWLDKATEHGTSVLCSPNFGYKYLIKHADFSAENKWDLSRVRILYNGAEPISDKICVDFLNRLAVYGLKPHSMCPVYGLAEATLAVSISDVQAKVELITVERNQLNFGDRISVRPAGEDTVTFVNVGKPVDNCLLRIVNNNNIAIEEDTIGNVQIKGAGVTAGYYNNEEATNEVLTTDGWLKTGDIGFIRDGSLYVTGRSKDVFFVNGQNYYPHDIENVAEAVPGIELNKIAIAGFINDDSQKEEVIAFVLHRGNINEFIPKAVLLKTIVNSKTGIEIDKVIPVADIPRTTSGKLQRFKLVEQFKKGNFDEIDLTVSQLMNELTARTHVAKSDNGLENHLVEIWQRVLKNQAIDIDQKFFDIGGNSLKAAEMLMLIWREMEVDLPIELLYARQTIRELAGEIKLLKKKSYLPIPASKKSDYYPLSAAQKRIYYSWQLDKSSINYNIPVAFYIKGRVNVNRLEGCIKTLVARHDSLRMSFHMKDEPVFIVHDAVDFALDCTECDEHAVKNVLKDSVQSFDLNLGRLFRIRLFSIDRNACILFMDFHHMISDGISVFNFVDELFALYMGKTLPVIPIQYKDYVAWERENLQSETIKLQERYWLNQLKEELPVLELPLDFPRPVIFSVEGEKISFEINDETSHRLRSLAKANQCSLHVLLFTIFNILLSKYTGQEDIVIGIPVGARRHPDLRNLLGMFVNSLFIRSSINGDDSFVHLLQVQMTVMANSLKNQYYPFDHLIHQAGKKRDVSRNPVFDTMFIYQNMGMPEIETAAFTVSPYFFDPGFSKYDMSLEIFDNDSALKYGIEYATKLFRKETITRFAEHFQNLISQILDNPDSKLANLSVLSRQEYDAFIKEFNDTASHYPSGTTIDQLFEQQAELTPENIAIEVDNESITYGQLHISVSNLAELLRKKGIGPNMVVGLLLERSPELIIGMLAVLKAGGCYLPIESYLPQDRIELLISHSRCKLIMVSKEKADKLQFNISSEIEIITVDQPVAINHQYVASSHTHLPHDLAYIIYTSGTTGHPKGVMIEHRSLVNYIKWAAAHYIRNEKVVFPLFTSIAFDLTITSIFAPLITGNKIKIFKDDPKAPLMEKVMADNEVNIIKLTPSHLKIIAENKLPSTVGGRRSIKFIVGGEQLETWLAEKIFDMYGGNIEIYNEYGPTEATVGCMIHKFRSGEGLLNVPIGVPAANTQIYILDKHLKPVPAGVKGELYIAGDGLARGYLYDDVLTSQKFIPNPFIEGGRMYKTGDIARRLPNNIIEYIGRVDKQVKINGYRIELSEIESHLINHPEIAEALVTMRVNKRNQKTLCAYYKSKIKWEDAIGDSGLRNYLADRLPHYMIPVYFIQIEQIPLTRNGKVDYDALPEPGTVATVTEKARPVNEIQALLIKKWEDVLGEEQLSVTDNFFELGGDSIKAVQIASRLSDEGISVSVKDILTYHTIEQISLRAEITKGENEYSQIAIEGEKQLGPIEAWFRRQKFKNPNYFNQSVLLRLKKKLNINCLEKTFEKLVEHHDGLRLNYDPEKNILFYNNNHLKERFCIEIYEINIADNSDQTFAEVCLNIKKSFDLTRSLLLKAAIIKDSGSDLLLITAHHLVIDGLSWRILLEDLYSIYYGLEKQISLQLPLKTATLIDWEKEITKYSTHTDLQMEKVYWNKADGVEFVIPTDFDVTDWKTGDQEKTKTTLCKELTHFLIKEAHQTYKTDIPILLNAALALTLREWTGLNIMVIEQENHGRHLEGINASRTLGWFTVMYPLKLELKDGPLSHHIKAIKEQFRQVPAFGLGYGIGKYLGHQPENAEEKLVEIRLNYLGQFDGELNNELFSYCDRSTGRDIDQDNKMTAKLELNLMIVSGELNLEVNYNKKAHRESTISWFTYNFLNQLQSILDHIKEEDEVHFTPSDFGAIASQEELDALFQ
jgi:amino acid adenylation domain-containing protein/non-ribosomal peptide synthase protein (TIGR01720 family)